MVTYMKGTRRVEEMLAEIRQLTYQETYSYTEGWDDNTCVGILNMGLNRLYAAITAIDNNATVNEMALDIVAGQMSYDIPQEVHMAIRFVDVRYYYQPQPWAFVTLTQGMIQDRFGYPTNIPDTYCIRDGKLLLSPTPAISSQNALVINYEKRLRSLDVRRGKVGSFVSGAITGISQANPAVIDTSPFDHGRITGDKVYLKDIGGMVNLNDQIYTVTALTSTTFSLDGVDSTGFPAYTSGGSWLAYPFAWNLSFAVNSQKDVNLQANANSILDKVDYCTFVDRNGVSIVSAIPLYGYNTSTTVLTADNQYIMTPAQIAAVQDVIDTGATVYVVTGDYASSHSELDRQCEDALIEYARLQLLRLQSAAEPTVVQLQEEAEVVTRLVGAYRRQRPTTYPVIWIERMKPRSWPFGPRGMY